MKKILSYSLVFVAVIILLSTCTGPDEIIPSRTTDDTVITIQERMEIFDACQKKSAELNNLKTLEDRVKFLAWLGTQPAFHSVGFAGEDLYAVFQDGRVALFVNTPLGEDIGGRTAVGGRPHVSSDSTYRSSHGNSIGRPKDVPKAKKVTLFTGLGALFPDNVAVLKSIFGEAESGYEVTIKDATIENLKGHSGDAVFYINTHGGAGNLYVKGGNLSIMALWTKDLVTPQLDTLYKDDIKNGKICYMFATNNTEACEWHYAITSAFVLEHMSFAENAFIYLDACNGFNESILGNVSFRERMVAKANGKATFVGWTAPTNTGVYPLTSQFVFDRLLGSNSGGNISQEDPFQRPFDLASVFADMRNEGLGIAQNGAQLTYRTTLEREVLLRPTIESMEVDEYTSTLTINGLFPWDQGHVTVNGVSAVVTSWNPYGIACTIRETGDGSVGEVIVVSAQGVKSNPVPLTEYIIKLNYSANDNGVVFAGVADLRLRADVHLRRSKIGETPSKPTYPDYSPTSGWSFNVKGSSAVYTVTGRKYDACNISVCHYQFTESPTPKVGRVDYTLPSVAELPLFAMYNWGPEMKTIKISFMTISVPDIPAVFEERVNCPEIDEVVIPAEFGYGAVFAFPTHELDGGITLEIADNFNIRPGSWTKTIDRPWSNCSVTGTFKQSASWEVIVPKHAPTDKTGARVAGDVSGN